MRKNNIIRISILPLIIAALAFTNLPPQKNEQKNDKGNKEREQSSDKGEALEHERGNSSHDNDRRRRNGQGNREERDDQGKRNRDDDREERDDRRENNNNGNNRNQGSNRSDDDDKGRHNENDDRDEMKDGNRSNKNMNAWKDDDINWNLDNFADRKRPKDQKKVTICHHPGGDAYPVTITISENAVQAHMRHGDQMGNCTAATNPDRWSSDYVQSRENVYNTYEQTRETVSYSNALLQYALDRLLGVKTNLDKNRANLTAQEVQRREALITDLQNNVISLEDQLNLTREKLDSNVNIIIKL